MFISPEEFVELQLRVVKLTCNFVSPVSFVHAFYLFSKPWKREHYSQTLEKLGSMRKVPLTLEGMSRLSRVIENLPQSKTDMWLQRGGQVGLACLHPGFPPHLGYHGSAGNLSQPFWKPVLLRAGWLIGLPQRAEQGHKNPLDLVWLTPSFWSFGWFSNLFFKHISSRPISKVVVPTTISKVVNFNIKYFIIINE